MTILFNDSVDLASVSQTYPELDKQRLLTSEISYTEATTVSGGRFSSEFDLVYGTGEGTTDTEYILYQMPPASSGVVVALDLRIFKSLNGEADLEILWDSTGIVTSTAIPAFNENRNSSKSAQMTINRVTSVVTEGTVRERDFLSGAGTGSNSSGAISDSSGFRLYSPDSFFIAKIVNKHNANNRIHIAYSWLEIPIQNIPNQ